jgi:hypothetical protein
MRQWLSRYSQTNSTIFQKLTQKEEGIVPGLIQMNKLGFLFGLYFALNQYVSISAGYKSN